MSIETILVPMDGSSTCAEVLDTAWVVAKRFDAHIEALHVMPPPTEGFLFPQLPARLRETVAEEAAKDAEEKATEVKAIFDAFCERHKVKLADKPTSGPTAQWLTEIGHVNEVLVRRARLTDMVAATRPERHPAALRRSPVGDVLEALIIESGRPVLLVPPGWAARKCEHAAFAWNESAEAARALAMVMPWLKQMGMISVLVSKKREASAKALLEYLGWHGVNAHLQWLDGKGDSAKEAITTVCSEINAEFLIVGGFSSARARQRLFGGVTTHLLTHANIITVMVH